MSTKKGDPQLSEISNKLSVLIRLLALNLVKDLKTQREQIGILSDSGFQPKQIADILVTSRNTVSVALNRIKKERETKESKEEINPDDKTKTSGV